MKKLICLDARYSTTRFISKDKPTLNINLEYKITPKPLFFDNKSLKHEGGLRTKGYFKKSYPNKITVSIITVVYNGEKHLEQAIKSVLEQDYDNIEYIIIDGDSTDKTISIIKQYEDYIDYWISEVDSGIYNAMNKGISLESGEYIAFLNSDDFYYKEIINKIIQDINKYSPDYLFANINIENMIGENYILKPTMEKYKVNMPFGHPSLFTKKTILQKLGFSENYKIVSDYDLVLKMIKINYSFHYMDYTIVNFRVGGISTTSNAYKKEYFSLMKSHFGIFYALYRLIKLFSIKLKYK